MNKIVFLLVASLVCANAAPLSISSGTVSALTDVILAKIVDINIKLFAVNNVITQLSADSTVLVPEDTESVAAIRINIIRDVFDILDGFKTAENAIAEVADDLKVLEDKFVAHCESDGELAGSSTAEIEAAIAVFTDDLKVLEDKFVAHCESDGELAGSSTAEIEAAIAVFTESFVMINDDAKDIFNIAAKIHALESSSS